MTNFDPASLKKNPSSPRTLFGLFMSGVAGLFTVIAIVPLLVILGYLLTKGISSLSLEALTGLPPAAFDEGGGFGNAILGTVVMVGIGCLISVPIGIMAAIYLSEFGRDSKLAQCIRFATNVLSGVPSIIIGVFAYTVIVLTTKEFSAWAGGFALSILMLPIIVRTTDEALKLVPEEVRQASIGVGANNYQTVLQVVLPAAIPAIITGVTLAISRAAGETAPLLFTALFWPFWLDFDRLFNEPSKFLVEPTASLAVLVYNFAIVPYQNQQELAWAAAFVLVLLVLATSIISRIAASRRTY